MSGKKAGRGVLRAQACNLKRAWRRVQVNSSLLLEQLLQHLSLGGGSMDVVYERLGQPPAADLAASSTDAIDNDHDQHGGMISALPANVAGHGDADDDDDQQQWSNVAACCINRSARPLMQHFAYQPLMNAARPHRSARRKRAKSPSSSNKPSSHNSPCSRLSPNSPNVSACSSIADEDFSGATVLLKISIVGDAETGKTTFMAKYVWPEGMSPEVSLEMVGVAMQEKVVHVKSRSTHIAFSIWDLGGHWQCGSMLPIVCRDAAAILIMFDLTRRSTLNRKDEIATLRTWHRDIGWERGT